MVVVTIQKRNSAAAILCNSGNTIVFRVGGEDASVFVLEFDHMIERQFFEADCYMANARILKDGIPYQYRLLTELSYNLAGGHRDNIIKQPALRFGYASEKVERETAHFFS